jgi:hypothetical protein
MRLLTINSGLSSLKAALFQTDPGEERLLRVSLTRIGLPGSHMTGTDRGGACLLDQQADLPSHEAALRALFDWLRTRPEATLDGVGHRIVLGDHGHDAPQRVTDGLLADLKALQSRDPEHMPAEIAGIATVRALFTALPQAVRSTQPDGRVTRRLAAWPASPLRAADCVLRACDQREQSAKRCPEGATGPWSSNPARPAATSRPEPPPGSR